jgi:D-arabinose 5-phosphate isomerase GutQ
MTEDAISEWLKTDRKLYLPSGSAGAASARGLQGGHEESRLHAEAGPDLSTVDGIAQAVRARALSIGFAINNTVVNSRDSIAKGVEEIQRWIENEEIVRVAGAGRARLAASIPANRLAHCGARVYVVHDVVPLPNTVRGGNVLAASASGKSEAVLQLMRTARRRNPAIRIMGIADERATDFAKLCDIFVGIVQDQDNNPYQNPLQALADTGEYIISELLDAMVVAAAKRLGMTDYDFRAGHEDLSDTGPYLPEDSSP